MLEVAANGRRCDDTKLKRQMVYAVEVHIGPRDDFSCTALNAL